MDNERQELLKKVQKVVNIFSHYTVEVDKNLDNISITSNNLFNNFTEEFIRKLVEHKLNFSFFDNKIHIYGTRT